MSAYPDDRACDVALRDGSTAHVRPVRSADHDAIRAFLGGLSPDSIWFRFFGAANLEWAADWSVDVDYVDRYGLIAETGTPARVIAHAAYLRIDAGRAEVAFMVADDFQGHGLSTILLAHLAEAAAAESITTFVADVLPANHRMIEAFRQSGFPVELRSEPGVIKIEFPTSMSAEAIARFTERDRIAAVAAVRRVLEPRSVAVIGGSSRRGTVGGEMLHNLQSPPTSAARCTSSIRTGGAPRASTPTARLPSCLSRSTSPSSRCPPTPCSTSPVIVRPPAYTRSS